MKKFLLSIAFIAIGTTSIKAQDIRFGAKAGLNISDIRSKENFDSRVSYHVGALAEIKINDKFSIQPELIYSLQGGKKEIKATALGASVSATNTVKLDYLNLPIIAKYYLVDNFSLELGPQIGFLLSAKGETEVSTKGINIPNLGSTSKDIKDDMKSIDFGLSFGAGYSINNINLGVRYNLGLTDLGKNTDDDYTHKNGVLQVSVGYLF